MHLLLPSTEEPLDNAGRADVAQKSKEGKGHLITQRRKPNASIDCNYTSMTTWALNIEKWCLFSSSWGEGA